MTRVVSSSRRDFRSGHALRQHTNHLGWGCRFWWQSRAGYLQKIHHPLLPGPGVGDEIVNDPGLPSDSISVRRSESLVSRLPNICRRSTIPVHPYSPGLGVGDEIVIGSGLGSGSSSVGRSVVFATSQTQGILIASGGSHLAGPWDGG